MSRMYVRGSFLGAILFYGGGAVRAEVDLGRMHSGTNAAKLFDIYE